MRVSLGWRECGEEMLGLTVDSEDLDAAAEEVPRDSDFLGTSGGLSS